MSGMIRLSVIGRVGNDPEIRTLQSGTTVCTVSLAVNKVWNDRNTNERHEKTIWVRASAWNQRGKVLSQYVRKGDMLHVEGEPSASAYINRDGEPASSLEVRIENFTLLGSRDSANASNGEPNEPNDSEEPPAMDDIPF